jgi:hypothetical protein
VLSNGCDCCNDCDVRCRCSLCELDAVNEYYIDEAAHKLYFYPPVPLASWTEGVYITQNMTAASIDADHVTLKGLSIQASRGNGVEAINHTGVRIENCEISGHGTLAGRTYCTLAHSFPRTRPIRSRGTGQHGVVVIGDNSGVADCNVYSVGCSGIRVSGGDARTLTHGHSYATGNSVRDMALHKRTYQPGIFWNGVGNNYSYNTVTNSPHNCIASVKHSCKRIRDSEF